MRVLLVNPPADHEIRGPHPFIADDMGVFPHLGLMYIAAVLRQDDEFEVKLVDMAMEKTSVDELLGMFREYAPQVVGLSSYTDCLFDLKAVVAALRKASDQVVICVGGPHIEAYPAETLQILPIQCVIRGDGEYAFRELCRRVRDGGDWHDVRGIGYLDSGQVLLNPQWQVEDLDQLPFPLRRLSPMAKVRSAVGRGATITSICSSRGCPFPCTFCNSPYKKYRLRSPQNVVAEIDQCHRDFGIAEFFFFDDLFNIDRKRLAAMCAAIRSLPYRISWSFRGRINFLDGEILRACKEAGCIRIHFGVESGNERALKIFKKGVKLADVRKVFRLCHEVGIETVANFMIGAPGETREEMLETIRFALLIKPTFVEFHVLVPYPYTEIYQSMLSSGSLPSDVWRQFALDPQLEFHPPLCEDSLDAKEMYALLNAAYRKFYFRPAYIARQLLGLTSLRDLRAKIQGAYRLLLVTSANKRAGITPGRGGTASR